MHIWIKDEVQNRIVDALQIQKDAQIIFLWRGDFGAEWICTF